ncbi:hypothetical protein PybrP1_006940 [[Pythium] brassicae (nom. inval.)]|nr:hypothetical protein PybrP1_006940 [[Pythium] brassicae (nom. inval.)]
MALLRSLTRQLHALSVTAPPRVAATRAFPGLAPPPFAASVFQAFAPNPLLLQQVRCMGYKLKTKSAVKKRFSVNCNGLVKRAQSNKRHIATKKTRERIRRLGKPVFVQGKIRKNILAMLGK